MARQMPRTAQVSLLGHLTGVFLPVLADDVTPASGLFHRAISQSGTALFRLFITRNPLKVAKVSASPSPGLSMEGQDGSTPEHPFFSL